MVAKHKERLFQARREQLDRGKVEYSQYDHALIGFGNKRYYLPIDQPLAILAARVLRTIADTPLGHTFVDGSDITQTVWTAMTTTERLMFAPPSQIFGIKGNPVHKNIMKIMSKVLSPMLVSRQNAQERFIIGHDRPAVGLHREPLDEGATNDLIPIFPPGTPREQIYRDVGDAIPDAAFTQADVLLNQVRVSRELLSQDKAIALLDPITNRAIQRALRSRLAAVGERRTFEDVRVAILVRAWDSLREGLEGAHLERTIAGYSAHGSHGFVRQIGGELPITTRSPKDTTSEWQVGKRQRR
jgi:hypothetical protein